MLENWYLRKIPTKNRKELISNPIFLLGPSNTNQGFPNNPNPEREARRVLDSYGGRSHYMENDEEATRWNIYCYIFLVSAKAAPYPTVLYHK